MIASFLSHARFAFFPLAKIFPAIHTPIHTRFIPRVIPFRSHLQPRAYCALGAIVKLQGPDLQKLGKQRGGTAERRRPGPLEARLCELKVTRQREPTTLYHCVSFAQRFPCVEIHTQEPPRASQRQGNMVHHL